MEVRNTNALDTVNQRYNLEKVRALSDKNRGSSDGSAPKSTSVNPDGSRKHEHQHEQGGEYAAQTEETTNLEAEKDDDSGEHHVLDVLV